MDKPFSLLLSFPALLYYFICANDSSFQSSTRQSSNKISVIITAVITPVESLSSEQQQRLASLSLFYNPAPAPAILCIIYQFAISPCGDRISRHLGEKHDVPKPKRHGLNSLIKSLRLPDPTSLPPQPDGSRPHPHLALQNGYGCRYCQFRSVSSKVSSQHLQHNHTMDKAIACASGSAPQTKRHHIQDGLVFQSWAANDTRRSWLVNHP